MATSDPLSVAAEAARRFLAGVADRPVGSAATPAELTAALGGPLPEEGVDAARVVADLARAADPGIVASAGPRYFGFVVGGSLPAAVAAVAGFGCGAGPRGSGGRAGPHAAGRLAGRPRRRRGTGDRLCPAREREHRGV